MSLILFFVIVASCNAVKTVFPRVDLKGWLGLKLTGAEMTWGSNGLGPRWPEFGLRGYLSRSWGCY